MNGSDPTDFDPYSPNGLAERVGRLAATCEALLEVLDEMPVALDPYHLIKIERARRTLDTYGCQTATR